MYIVHINSYILNLYSTITEVCKEFKKKIESTLKRFISRIINKTC